MSHIQVGIQLEVRECPDCSILYGVPLGFIKNRRNDHVLFYCPNGHGRYFPQMNDEEKLRKQLTEAMARETRLKEELVAKEKETKRIQRRIKNGVCPDCKRTFSNLKRHMESEHKTH